MHMNNFTASIRDSLKKPLGFSFKFIPYINRALKNSLTIFVFHDVTDAPSMFSKEYGISVSLDTFHHQASWIKENFEVIHPSKLLDGSTIVNNAAIISFDDGFLGSFDNGLRILKRMGLPSVFFLNMKAVLEQTPILSATACYLSRYSPEFINFSENLGLSRPFHLTLNPSILKNFESQYGLIDQNAVIDYQGQFANIDTVKKWGDENCVVFGNHLFEHWNACALSTDELDEQYKKNEVALSQLENKINLFAFTNGQPETCYSQRDVDILGQLGAGRIFSASGGINNDAAKYLLGRLSLGEGERDEYKLWYRMGKIAFKMLLGR